MKKFNATPALLLAALMLTGQAYLWGAVRGKPRAASTIGNGPDGSPGGGERGDVPGWVMITLMSAILVAGLLTIALPALKEMFTQAMEQIKPQG